ncbi:AbgT family transporter [Atopococcus tabaci]|uniref:AbgT family transporter n=1 Tax=Atopococcus tabaci TaxID=269774 RepID=UPI00240A5806|nr:AbgT family transporter [Atopococcus tabaci]
MKDQKKRSAVDRFLSWIERVGNKTPNPVIIFILLIGVIIFASWVFSLLGVSSVNPATNEVVQVESLLTKSNLIRMIEEAITNFTAFPALGLVLTVMLGIGLAEQSGYFEVMLTSVVEKAPKNLVLWVIILVGVLGNVAGDAAPIVMPPLAAIIFLKMGYHPIAGAIVGYVAPLGGFAANLIPGMSDALVFAFTEPAAALVDPSLQVNVLMNYYFIAFSTPILVMVIYWILKKYTLPRLGTYNPEDREEQVEAKEYTKQERAAVKWGNWSALLVLLVLLLLTIPENGLLRNQETGSIVNDSPLMNGIGIIMTIFFFVPGLVYGIKAGTINNSHDFAFMLTKSMQSMGSFIVIVFFASQMMAYFNWSNLGTVLAVEGAGLLQNASGPVLIIGFILLTAFINMFIGSASSKWAILAPIFIPMFMLLDFHPAFTQMAYRIGDSITNPLSPMMPYMPLLLAVVQRYDKKSGIGTLMANALPYSVAIGIIWTVLFIVWYLIGLPLGPNSPAFLS